jgi:hypothetical protein
VSTAIASADLLTQAVAVARRHIESGSTTQERWRALWAGAKHARRLAASDVVAEEFTELGKQLGLAKGLGRSADEDLRHVIDWACRGLNPFGKGPLQ